VAGTFSRRKPLGLVYSLNSFGKPRKDRILEEDLWGFPGKKKTREGLGSKWRGFYQHCSYTASKTD